MIDDQDRCEWVNVSSGTSSHGLSQHTRKTELFLCIRYGGVVLGTCDHGRHVTARETNILISQ